MDSLLSLELWLGALVIFLLRVVNMTLDTLRMLYVMRGKKTISWVLGFFVSVIYVVLLTSVLSNLNNILYIIAYAAGFSTGSVIGMVIEERLALGYSHIQVVSAARGTAVAEKLREAGFAVTEIPARGKDGMVSMLSLSVLRKQAPMVEKIVLELDENAFITSETIQPVRRGYWRA